MSDTKEIVLIKCKINLESNIKKTKIVSVKYTVNDKIMKEYQPNSYKNLLKIFLDDYATEINSSQDFFERYTELIKEIKEENSKISSCLCIRKKGEAEITGHQPISIYNDEYFISAISGLEIVCHILAIVNIIFAYNEKMIIEYEYK